MAVKRGTKKGSMTASRRLSAKTKPRSINKKTTVQRTRRVSKRISRIEEEENNKETDEENYEENDEEENSHDELDDDEVLSTYSGESGGDDKAGGYADNTLHPDTLRFLKDLAKHNDRDWFHGHKDIYKIALADFKSFSSTLQEELTQVDWTVPILPLERHNLFRIYRDIRFSSSKVPFKEYFSVAFSRTGKQGLYAKYYLSIQPGDQSFIGNNHLHTTTIEIPLLSTWIDLYGRLFASRRRAVASRSDACISHAP
ncbi:hypothetical protein TWF730_009528 [Orbilia blumenaviensis]|uniref:Uncharacterized protein n=1 Tax=Orbilia blumenaviensis TaxID=1796055 RepID=A0AAV9USD3_9PEZI